MSGPGITPPEERLEPASRVFAPTTGMFRPPAGGGDTAAIMGGIRTGGFRAHGSAHGKQGDDAPGVQPAVRSFDVVESAGEEEAGLGAWARGMWAGGVGKLLTLGLGLFLVVFVLKSVGSFIKSSNDSVDESVASFQRAEREAIDAKVTKRQRAELAVAKKRLDRDDTRGALRVLERAIFMGNQTEVAAEAHLMRARIFLEQENVPKAQRELDDVITIVGRAHPLGIEAQGELDALDL